MSGPVGLYCPGCGEHAAMALAGLQQAFCGNDECAVFCWNPQLTREELQADVGEVNLDGEQ